MANPELSPQSFNMPPDLRWAYDVPRPVGTLLLSHTMRLGPMRTITRLQGNVLDGYQEDPTWRGFGITSPQGSAYPIRDDFDYKRQYGKDRLDPANPKARGGTALLTSRGALDLIVGRVSYYDVGPHARVAVLTPNREFDPEVAESLAAKYRDSITTTELSHLNHAEFDPTKYLKGVLLGLRGHEPLEIGTNFAPEVIHSLSHDTVSTAAVFG